MMRSKQHTEKIGRKTLKVFIPLFLLSCLALGSIIAAYHQMHSSAQIKEINSSESQAIKLETTLIGNIFGEIISDLLTLADQNELNEYLQTGSQNAVSQIQGEYINILTHKRNYDQLRFIDNTGQEIVRTDFNEGLPSPTAKPELQNKSKRYYFKNSLRLRKGEIFVSPLDLNVEHGKIEQPLKPVIRLGTPVFDALGTRRGVVLVNYLAKRLLDTIRQSNATSLGSSMLINSDGYWLLGNRPQDEWGFMIKERADRTFAHDYPDEWARILADSSGQFQTSNGLFTFHTVYPLDEGHVANFESIANPRALNLVALDPQAYFWVLLSHVPPQTIQHSVRSFQSSFSLLVIGVLFISAAGTWLLALAITKRRLYQEKLITMALYDALTGLPNRKLFFDHLEHGIGHAKRHGRRLGLLYIDLDGFKGVNDTLGHDAGDELLIKVSEIMQHSSRKSDTVARLGGDEFAIILFEITSTQDALTAGNKLISALKAPINLSAGMVTIGASIGAAIYPETSTDQETLIKHADAAMYQSKEQGKNRCTVAEPEEK